jgi:phosphoadenosine phosphosulfate reductase
MQSKIEEVQALLKQLHQNHGESMAFSSSFSMEDQVIAHLLYTLQVKVRVFTLDTGRLFPETYSVMERTRANYQLPIDVYVPNQHALEQFTNEKGWFSFYESIENRLACCKIRKVEPLSRALVGVTCWITGIRSEHSENREQLRVIEEDSARKLQKVHPLLHWNTEDVKAYIDRYQIPYNSLHDKGFVSIGCQPCTRAIAEGEDFRSGRWWWEDNSKKECGLHSR